MALPHPHDAAKNPHVPRPPQHSSKRRASEGSVPPQADDDAQYWKNMFYSLQQQRTIEAEASLLAFSEESEKREESLKAYIHHLETQVVDLKKTSDGFIREKKKETEEVEAALAKQTKEIELYRLLTGTTLSNVDESKPNSCDCTVSNQETSKSTSFRLTGSPSPDENEVGGAAVIKYEPIGEKGADLSLPSFLHAAIEFDASQAPALMQNVLQGMFPDED